MKKSKSIKVVAIILWIIQLAAEGLLVYALLKTSFIPSTYMALTIAGAAVLLVITGILAFLTRTDKKKTTARLVIGCILSALIAGGCVYGFFTITKIREKVENVVVTDVKTVTSNIGVYTLSDNDAESIADAGEFIFAVNTFYDAENTDAAVEIINAENGFSIKTKVYETPANMVTALYAGEVDAMILNEAYMGIFEDLYETEGIEEFKNIRTNLKMIHEIKANREIEDEAKAETDDEAKAEADDEAEAGDAAKAEIVTEEGRLLMHSAARANETKAATAKVIETKAAAAKAADVSKNAEVTSAEVSKATAPDTAAEAPNTTKSINVTKDPYILYISGSDTRSETLEVSRSDVNILIVVNPESRQVLLVNTPRDYYIENPAGDNALDKLTHCGIYGMDCSVEALENLYDIDIDFYAQFNFAGFEEFVDAIGGVTVVSDIAFSADGYDYVEGENELDGAMALTFVRERHSFEEGDNQRGINQMKMISAIVDKISENSMDILGNFAEILDSLDKMFVTNMTGADLAGISLLALANEGIWELMLYAVEGEDSYAETYSMPGYEMYVMIPDMDTVDRASELIGMVLAGESLFDDEEPEGPEAKQMRAFIDKPLARILAQYN